MLQQEIQVVRSGDLSKAPRTLRAAFTPDPDDAYAWWALATGRVRIGDWHVETSTAHIQDINEACLRGEYDIGAISSAAYPALSKNYVILSSGASVGRGYGPALATKNLQPADLNHGVVVAIPGEMTTGALLLRLFFPNVKTVAMRFDEIAPAIIEGHADAGVLIHEELLNWSAAGLRRLVCLGKKWTEETGLPIPVGLNVVHRRLGSASIGRISAAIRQSMVEADANEREATAWAMKYSREAEPNIGSRFMKMFANTDTLRLDDECLAAMRLLFEMGYKRGLLGCVPTVETV